MAPVDVLLRDILPHVSAEGRALLTVLARDRGRLSAAAFHAAQVGLRSRHQLARCLKRDGLPPLEELAGWVSVMIWVVAWESNGTSLFRNAINSNREPATCYRTVKRITGLSWRAVRERGMPWVLLQFRERCTGPRAPDRLHANRSYGLSASPGGARQGAVKSVASGGR